MHPLSFIPCDTPGAFDALVGIHTEYLAWVHGEIAQAFATAGSSAVDAPDPDSPTELVHTLCVQRPPTGVAYLITVDGSPAGMCGLRSLGGGAAEIKRLYVRPAYRGMHVGDMALRKLLADAGRFGHARVCLDTAPFMQSAQRLYAAHGFTDCAPYEGSEVPPTLRSRWRFMQRMVGGLPGAMQAQPQPGRHARASGP